MTTELIEKLEAFYQAVAKDSGDPFAENNATDDECVGWDGDGTPMALTFKIMREAHAAIAVVREREDKLALAVEALEKIDDMACDKRFIGLPKEDIKQSLIKFARDTLAAIKGETKNG